MEIFMKSEWILCADGADERHRLLVKSPIHHERHAFKNMPIGTSHAIISTQLCEMRFLIRKSKNSQFFSWIQQKKTLLQSKNTSISFTHLHQTHFPFLIPQSLLDQENQQK
jgi:hypothetical protein